MASTVRRIAKQAFGKYTGFIYCYSSSEFPTQKQNKNFISSFVREDLFVEVQPPCSPNFNPLASTCGDI